MSRSVTIVNTSNHDEAVHVHVGATKHILMRGDNHRLSWAENLGIILADGHVSGREYMGELDVVTVKRGSYIPGQNIGWAVCMLKDGQKVARRGWNGKDMYLYLENFACQEGSPQYSPCITMHTAQGDEQRGWLASQADLLAIDWLCVQ